MTSIQLDSGGGASGGGGGGATNLGYVPGASNGVVTSSTGTSATIPVVDATNAGLMTPAQRAALIAAAGTNLSYTAAPTQGTVVSDTGTDATVPAVDATNAGLMLPAQRAVVQDMLTSPAQGDVVYYNGTAWVKLPAGTSGQFLKTNGAGANPAWSAAGGGGGSVATDAIWTAKGQLAAATGNAAAVALAAGSDNEILVADSSQSAGVKWLQVMVKHPRPVSTWFGLPGCFITGIGSYVGFANRRVYAYFRVESPVSLTDYTCYVVSGAGTARPFVQAINPSTGAASSVVADFGAVDVSTGGQKTATLGIPVTLTTGLYALAVSTSSTPTIYQYAVVGGIESIVDVSASNNAVGQPRLLSAPGTDTSGPSFIAAGAPNTLGLLKWTVI